jgi:hypothetical protein
MSSPIPLPSRKASALESGGAPPPTTTLGELIAAVDEATGGSDETVRVVDHLLRSGRIRRAHEPSGRIRRAPGPERR